MLEIGSQHAQNVMTFQLGIFSGIFFPPSSFQFQLFSGQICDLAEKLESWDQNSLRGSFGSIGPDGSGGSGGIDKKTEDKLSKATKDSCKITTEVLHGLMTQVCKLCLFKRTLSLTPILDYLPSAEISLESEHNLS